MNQSFINIRGIDIKLERTDSDTNEYLKSILSKIYNILTEEEVEQLQDREFCREKFGFNYPLLQKDKTLLFISGKKRYYSEKFKIKNFFICNHWHTANLKKWTEYLFSLDEKNFKA